MSLKRWCPTRNRSKRPAGRDSSHIDPPDSKSSAGAFPLFPILGCLAGFLFLSLFFSLAGSQKSRLTLQHLYDPRTKLDFTGSPPGDLRWMRDGRHYLHQDRKSRTLFKTDAVTGSAETLLDEARIRKALSEPGLDAPNPEAAALGWFRLSPDGRTILFKHSGDLFLYDLESGTVSRLTRSSNREELAEFSPDGRLVSFVRDQDLYFVQVENGRELRLTQDGGGEVSNGKLNWLYQEELYGRGNFKGYWWSPDSSHLAFLQLDDSPVPAFTLLDYQPLYPSARTTRYPKAGDPNPRARIGVVAVSGQAVRWIGNEPEDDRLVVRVGWSPDGAAVVFQEQNRVQTRLDLKLHRLSPGSTTTLLREEGAAWVDVLAQPRWLTDGSFLWMSDRTGWRHLYHYRPDGTLIGPVTSGPWNVHEVLHHSPETGEIHFTADRDGPGERHLYRSPPNRGPVVRVSREPGTHRPRFNDQGSLYLDTWSDIDSPPRLSVHDANGTLLREIHPSRRENLDRFRLSSPRFLQVPTRDGFIMEAMMILPHDFDPARMYPVLVHVYGGPGLPRVRRRWGGTNHLWHQLMAQEGYLIWVCDNRSASGKGARSAWPVHRNFGTQELRDLEDGLEWLRERPYVDPDRIGVWGWSFGGYLASFALTHSGSFRIGIAGAPVTDWRLYDTIYTERYMGLPKDNPEGYRKSSVLEAAGDLKGKLLLIHGALDDNVHLQNTLRLAHRLQEEGRDFQMMIYPRARHGVRDPEQVHHLRRLMTQFILDHL